MKTKIILLLSVALLLSSCAGLTRVTVPCSPINMGERDIETERFVEYTLKKTYVLGIGGLTKKARNTNIVEQLIRKADLKENEALAYITVSRNTNAYAGPVVVIDKFIASGYVVRPVRELPVTDLDSMEKSGGITVPSMENKEDNSYISNEKAEIIRRVKSFSKMSEYYELKKDIDDLFDVGEISSGEKQQLTRMLAKRRREISSL